MQTQNNALVHVRGRNFSGRSRFLRSLADGAHSDSGRIKYIYLGEQPSNFITGIVPSVKNEIELHATNANLEVWHAIKDLLRVFDFEKHFRKNPFVLSGGEQAVVAILCNLLLSPKILAIDSMMEQLNEEWRSPLLNAMIQGKFLNSRIYLSDNRVEEYGLNGFSELVPDADDLKYEHRFTLPSFNPSFIKSSGSHTIEIKDLSFSYNNGNPILQNASVVLEPGKMYFLNGKNGAGKTTFAKLLSGLLKINEGEIIVDGKKFNSYRYPGHLAGYSFQNPDEQLFSSTVETEVLAHKSGEVQEYYERRESYLEMFGLKDVRSCHPAELPFVIRKRISLAATLATDRKWYILDEPTLGQDDHFVDFLVVLLNQLAENGKGIIIISHSRNFIQKIKCKNLSLALGKITI